MSNSRFLPLLGALLVCNGVLLEAQAADDAAQKQQELSQSIQRQILSLNVNQAEKYQIDFHFSSFHGMYAYRELLLWAQAATQQQRNDLMAMTRTGLEAVVRDSGMGLPLSGDKWEGQPVGLLFSKGLPRYTALPDFTKPATLKWDPARFERQTAPETVGQSLAAKSLYVLTDTSDDAKKSKEIMLASALQEFQTILPLLELGGDKGVSYMPAQLKLEQDKWSATNASSHLYGQMSLIQGLARLHALLLLPALETETVAGKRVNEWRKEVRRTLEKVYQTTIKLHLDTKAGSFVSNHEPIKGASDRLGAEDAGYALEVLADLAASLQKDDPLREAALKQLAAQADYVVARLDGKPLAPKTFLVKKNQTFAGMLLQLDDQLSIVNGLLAAEQAATGKHYGKTALDIFNAAHETLWSAPAGIFRSAAGQTVTAYDGRMFGLTLATWRRLEKSLPPGEARKHGERLIEAVLKQGGLLQAEGPATGEPKQPETFIHDELPQLIDSIIALKKEEQSEKIMAAVKSLSDQDGDGVPGSRFAGGRFGSAPVLVIQTSIRTTFDPPPDKTTPPVETTPPRSTP
jgi:hypothetical protein